MKTDDLSLLTQVAVFHNKRAFDKLVVKYQSQVRRFFINQTGGDIQLSDDLAQETFVKAYLNIGKFRGAASFSTWLYRIAYNVFCDYARSHKTTELLDKSPALKRSADTGDTELQIDLQDALAILSPAERVCITLQLIDGYPIEDISRITEMPEGTVKSHLSRGKKKLAMHLRKNGYSG